MSKDSYAWRKSLTVYTRNDCRKLAKIKKKCSSWNNDIEVFLYDENGDLQPDPIASTDYRVRQENTLDVYLSRDQTEGQSVLTIAFGLWDKITATLTFGGDTNMLVLDPRITSPIGGDISEEGKLIATLNGDNFFNTEININDPDGSILYNLDSPFNLEINPCRSENPLASAFYTVVSFNNATSVIPPDVFVAAMSTLVINFTDNDADACTNWTLIYRWVILAVGIVLLLAGAAYGGFLAFKKLIQPRRTMRSESQPLPPVDQPTQSTDPASTEMQIVS